uniref:Uncharacterized protein n=1 Tax=Kalanchoe fedtschenkoi TaxID=63787 RepID=A0A7N0VFC7_KALFE
MPRGTLEVLLVGAKGLENTDFLSNISSPSSFLFVLGSTIKCDVNLCDLWWKDSDL